jgi:hypothetical protein
MIPGLSPSKNFSWKIPCGSIKKIAGPGHSSNCPTSFLRTGDSLLSPRVACGFSHWIRWKLESCGVRFPFWSPDSAYIGFLVQGKLKKISVNGSPAQTLCDGPIGVGGTWNSEGAFYFSPQVLPSPASLPSHNPQKSCRRAAGTKIGQSSRKLCSRAVLAPKALLP